MPTSTATRRQLKFQMMPSSLDFVCVCLVCPVLARLLGHLFANEIRWRTTACCPFAAAALERLSACTYRVSIVFLRTLQRVTSATHVQPKSGLCSGNLRSRRVGGLFPVRDLWCMKRLPSARRSSCSQSRPRRPRPDTVVNRRTLALSTNVGRMCSDLAVLNVSQSE